MSDVVEKPELGKTVLEELSKLNIAPLPECYEVLYVHLRGSNADMSAQIQARQDDGLPLDEDFLTRLCDQYCRNSELGPVLAESVEQMLTQIDDIKGVAQGLTASSEDFCNDVESIASSADAPDLGSTDVKSIIEKLVSTAAEATRRNSELEGELTQAMSNVQSLKDAVKEIEHDAFTDFLTKLGNRRRFDNFLDTQLKPDVREGKPFSLIVGDVDHFKKFNDTYGHQVGDQVLRFVAAILSKHTKGQDLVARYGGEEFAIALPNTTLENAHKLADQIRGAIAKKKLVSKTTNEDLGSVTISFGVAHYAEGLSPGAFFEFADRALYHAKNTGRNRVATFEEIREREAS
ncbi:MAG: GGDEF domain-containing protein [Pseudomonadota bacterium]